MIAVILFRYSPLHNLKINKIHCHWLNQRLFIRNLSFFSIKYERDMHVYAYIYIYTVEPEWDTIACLLQAKLTCACYRLCNLHTSTCSTGCRKTKTKILPAGVSLYSTSNQTYATAFKLRKRETELFASTKEIQNNWNSRDFKERRHCDHATDGCKIYTAIYDEPCKIKNQLADDRN